MKRLLLSLFALLATVSMWAQWTEPSPNDYKNSTPIYVKVNVNGMPKSYGVTAAAFIGDECRAVSEDVDERVGYYMLRVRGNDADMNKTITFKVEYNGVIYKLKKTLTFTGETYANADGSLKAFELNVDAPTGIELKRPIKIEQKIPFEYDLLKNDFKFTYDDPTAVATTSTLKGESTIESTITYVWDYDNSSEYFTVDTKGILSGKKVTGPDGAYLGLQVILDKTVLGSTYTFVQVVEPSVFVTSMTLSKSSLEVNMGDNVFDMIRRMVTILPADAGDKSVSIEVKGESAKESKSFPNGVASQYGTFTLVVTANGTAPGATPISKEVTVKVLQPVSFDVPESIEVSKYKENAVQFTNLAGDGFDASKVEFIFINGQKEGTMQASGSGLKWTLTVTDATRRNNPYEVRYNGQTVGRGEALLLAEMPLQNGWNWFAPEYVEMQMGSLSLISYTNNGKEYKDFVKGTATSKITEIRSQLALLYNDPNWGVFGDIERLTPDSMYKVKVTSSNGPVWINLGMDYDFACNYFWNGISLKQGYNWIGLPIVGYRTAAELEISNAEEGDLLIGKDGFAEFNGKTWEASSNFRVEAGKGYLYHTGNAKSINCATSIERKSAPVRNARSARRQQDVFNFDASQFADNMAIVARIDGFQDKHNIVVGAFVGNECRGMGELSEDGKLMICVAGKNGEQVSFRLYDAENDEFIGLNETVRFTQKMGSLNTPICLSGDVIQTGLSDVSSVKASSDEIFDLAGRRVAMPQKGIFVVNGRKVMK